jgi:hypothetical protein
VDARRWLSTTESRRFLLTMQRCCFGNAKHIPQLPWINSALRAMQ